MIILSVHKYPENNRIGNILIQKKVFDQHYRKPFVSSVTVCPGQSSDTLQ